MCIDSRNKVIDIFEVISQTKQDPELKPNQATNLKKQREKVLRFIKNKETKM